MLCNWGAHNVLGGGGGAETEKIHLFNLKEKFFNFYSFLFFRNISTFLEFSKQNLNLDSDLKIQERLKHYKKLANGKN